MGVCVSVFVCAGEEENDTTKEKRGESDWTSECACGRKTDIESVSGKAERVRERLN